MSSGRCWISKYGPTYLSLLKSKEPEAVPENSSVALQVWICGLTSLNIEIVSTVFYWCNQKSEVWKYALSLSIVIENKCQKQKMSLGCHWNHWISNLPVHFQQVNRFSTQLWFDSSMATWCQITDIYWGSPLNNFLWKMLIFLRNSKIVLILKSNVTMSII